MAGLYETESLSGGIQEARYGSEIGLVVGHGVVAVMAADVARLVINSLEHRFHRFVVGDALGIAALHYAADGMRKLHLTLLHHLIVADNIHHGCGGDEGNAVEVGLGEKGVGHLDYPLFAQFAAFEIVTDGELMLHVGEAENLDALEQRVRRYMVYHGAVAEGSHGQFCMILLHDVRMQEIVVVITLDGDQHLRGSIPRARQMSA